MSHDPVCYTRILYGHRNVLFCCDINTHYVMHSLQTSIMPSRKLANLHPGRIRALQFTSGAIALPWLPNDDSAEPDLNSRAKALLEDSYCMLAKVTLRLLVVR